MGVWVFQKPQEPATTNGPNPSDSSELTPGALGGWHPSRSRNSSHSMGSSASHISTREIRGAARHRAPGGRGGFCEKLSGSPKKPNLFEHLQNLGWGSGGSRVKAGDDLESTVGGRSFGETETSRALGFRGSGSNARKTKPRRLLRDPPKKDGVAAAFVVNYNYMVPGRQCYYQIPIMSHMINTNSG